MSYSYNQCTLLGRLVSDPEIQISSKGNVYSKTTIASNYGDECSFIPFVCFNKTAKYLGDNLHKGDLILISGRITQSKYQDNEGNNHSRISILAHTIQYLSSPKSNNEEVNNDDSYYHSSDPVPDDIPF